MIALHARVVTQSSVRPTVGSMVTAFLVALVLVAPVPVRGQPVPENAPASLLRRLAEAADTYRNGQSIWIVLQTSSPHLVSGVYPSVEASNEDPNMGVAGYARYGPFRTGTDLDFAVEYFGPCPHYRRPPTMIGCLAPIIPITSIVAINIDVITSTDTVRYTLAGDSVDAMAFNMAAFDKFFAPYYTSAYSAAYATMLRDSLEAQLRRSPRHGN